MNLVEQEAFFSGISSQMTLYSEELECVLITYVCKPEPSASPVLPNPSHPIAASCCCPVTALSVCMWVSFRIRFTSIAELPLLCCTLCNTQLIESICKNSYPGWKYLIWWIQMRQQQYWTLCCDSKQWPKWNSFTHLFPFYFLTYLSE